MSVPRASGDKPGSERVIKPFLNVFPAPAGINLRAFLADEYPTCVPRASGDKPRLLRMFASQ